MVQQIMEVQFANSIVTYFMLAALLGVETYAVREGARIRNDRKK